MPALTSAIAMPDEEHDSDKVPDDLEGEEESYNMFTTPTAETYAHLPKPIRDNINFCIQAIQTSYSEYQDAIGTINTAFDAQKLSLDEQHARAKAQEAAFEKRKALCIGLPTNQVVNPVHNALLAEHAHERVLNADTFRAVKMGKVDMRAAQVEGLAKAKEVYLRQRRAFMKLIEGWIDMAEKTALERRVAEQESRATGLSAAVRSPAPASYSQTAARAPPITTSFHTQIDNSAALAGLNNRSGLMGELRNSPVC
ncbi:hypothetical protein BKA58DRAFT_50674 [Alternaria rosae]|uniref:uncharacterized protein n=1 Tax=Alternaria rosae TaxID=1187941 RepID=UPI001E8CED7D|nr:uncharacterized protein BKA58DRAFT_50674 [Alternaria rosae]KAH6858933.1 hypothetical protein BKA58DRAFT_50674 [Alternaria rosae]